MTAGLVATRSELLARRTQRAFAEQGRDLIWDKRTALVREFHRHRVEVLRELADLGRVGSAARQALRAAQAEDGAPAVAAAGLAAGGIEVSTRRRTVAGVPVIELDAAPVPRGPRARGWAPVAVSPHVDAAAAAYEHYLDRVLEICHLELTLRRLAGEIARATRQVNALETVVVPRLAAEAAAIAAALDEREREEHTRLKRARSRRGSRQPAAPEARVEEHRR